VATTKSEILIFTGAGASKPLGFPTTFDFFANDAAYQPLLSFFPNGIADVETVLDLLNEIERFKVSDAGKFFEVVTKQAMHTRNAYTEHEILVNKIWSRCREVYSPLPTLEKVKSLFLPLFELIKAKEHTVDFFTTNYDPITDVVLELAEELHFSKTDGFDSLGLWKPELLDSDCHFRLFRLHGSMSYNKGTDGRIRNTRIYDTSLNPQSQMLLYPGYKGDPAGADDIYKIPHERFMDSMMSCRQAIFIGFSFRDPAINKTLVTAWGARSRPPSFFIWNPISQPQLKKSLPQEVTDYHHLRENFGSPNALNSFRVMWSQANQRTT
jgi:SIR2-like domain